MRRDRKRPLTVLADHDILGAETPATLFARVQPKVEALTLPEGYSISWGENMNHQKMHSLCSLPHCLWVI